MIAPNSLKVEAARIVAEGRVKQLSTLRNGQGQWRVVGEEGEVFNISVTINDSRVRVRCSGCDVDKMCVHRLAVVRSLKSIRNPR